MGAHVRPISRAVRRHGDWSLVRWFDRPGPTEPLVVDGPLRIRGATVSPLTSQADLELERSRVDSSLARLVSQHQLEVTWLSDTSRSGLFGALRSGQWHVLHYIVM